MGFGSARPAGFSERVDRFAGSQCNEGSSNETGVEIANQIAASQLPALSIYGRLLLLRQAPTARVAAPERLAAMLAVRRGWAKREELAPDVIEDLYRRVVAYFIERELGHWRGTAGDRRAPLLRKRVPAARWVTP